MHKSKFNLVVCSFILLFSANSYAQEFRAGGALIYNLKTRGFGLGIRAEFPLERFDLLEGFSVVPQISYFPAFNEVSEFNIGSSLHLGVYEYHNWLFYGLANVSYRGWINYEDSNDPDAKFSNLMLDGGVGVTRNTCWRPFLELRLNAIGIVPSIHLGILYTFRCDRRGMVPCSKIPPPPKF
jgi:hypothetical protein